jgi:hypothetical protein
LLQQPIGAPVIAYSIHPRPPFLFETQTLAQTNTTDKTASDETESAGWEGIAMALIALLSFSAGVLLALRSNVLVLLAAVVAVLPLVVLVGIARGEGAGSLAVDMMVTVTCIEGGYIIRLIAYGLADAARLAVTAATEIRIAVMKVQ